MKNKKIAVFKNGEKVADIGMLGYRDFHSIKQKDRQEAEKAKKAYRARHGCDKDPGPKWKAKYWSCKFWSTKSVTDLMKG